MTGEWNQRPPPTDRADFLRLVEALAYIFRLSESSGLRTHKHNLTVGGAKRSQHRLAAGGLAVDLVPDQWPPANLQVNLLDAIHRLGLRFLVESDHIHVQARAPHTHAPEDAP